jgi:hypothetical protein
MLREHFRTVEADQVIRLEIELPSGKWLPLRGHVTSYQPGIGFGILFGDLSGDLSNEEKLELHRLIAK